MQTVWYTHEITALSGRIDPSVVAHIKTGHVGTLERLDDAYLLAFDWCALHSRHMAPTRVVLYLEREQMFVFCETEAAFEKMSRCMEEVRAGEHVFTGFFQALFKDDNRNLEALEGEITALENALLDRSKSEFVGEIKAFRKELLRLKRYYEELNDSFEGLLENEIELFSKTEVRSISILHNRVDRLVSNVINLREYVTQVREAYQAQIDIEQNSIMKIFTVITSVFLPLSLLVGWYGMNLKMPEFGWTYGYPMVIGLSVLICLVCVIVFKKKKWF